MQTILYLMAGLAFFLYGIDLLGALLGRMAGGRLQERMDRLASTDGRRYLYGALATVVFQSSSATTVLLVSMASAGLVTATEAFSFTLGANLGAVSTGWIAAVKITVIGLPLFIVGVVGKFFASNAARRELFAFCLGLGLILFGLDLMSQAMEAVRDNGAVTGFFARFDVGGSAAAMVLAALSGVLFTAVIQSSGATAVIAIAGAMNGIFSLHQACALVLGATLGTTVTALIAAVGGGSEGRRTAVMHTLLNVVGLLGGLLLFYPLVWAAGQTVPALGVAMAVALYMTLHKVILTVGMFPFRRPFAERIMRLVPDRFPGVHQRLDIRPLPRDATDDAVRTELTRRIDLFTRYLRDMFAFSLIVALKKREAPLLTKIEQYEQIVDQGHKKLVHLIHDQNHRHQQDLWLFLKMSDEAESMADHFKSVAKYGVRLRERQPEPLALERLLIHTAHRRVFMLFDRVCICKCFDSGDLAPCDEAERVLRRHKRELMLTITEEHTPLESDAILELADILSEYSKINHSVKRILQVNLDVREGRGVYLYKNRS